MAKIIFGVFHDPAVVANVLHQLTAAGFAHDNISLVARHADGKCCISDTQDHDGDGCERGMGTGVAIGGALGALTMGVSMIAIPPLGLLAVGGPLLALVLATGIGAAAGGLVGSLADMGVSKEEAEYYCSVVGKGGILVAVKCTDTMCDRAEEILNAAGAENVTERPATFAPEELHNLPDALVYTLDTLPPENTFESHIEDFQAHFLNSGLSETGLRFESVIDAYRYGYQLGTHESGLNADWMFLEPEARADWEERNGATWYTFREAVRYGWETARRTHEAHV